MKKYLLSTLFFFISYLSFSQNSNIILDTPQNIIVSGLQTMFLDDTLSKLSLEQILQPEQQKLFKTTNLVIPNFANTSSAIWGKFTIENKTHSKWILEIGNPLIDSINFYVPVNGTYEMMQTGAMFPHNTRNYKNNLFLFNLTTENDTITKKTFYFRLKSNFPLQVPLSISTLQPLLEENHRTDLGMGIYLGFMIVMALYNLFVFLSVKDKIYLYYVGYVVFLALVYAGFKGYAFEFLWANISYINYYIPTNSNIALIFMLLFASNFLSIKQYLPKWYKFILYILFPVFILSTLINPFNYAISANISQPFTLITALYLLIVGIILLKKGVKVARFYLLAWSFYLVGIIVYILNLNSVLPVNTFTNNSILFGSAIEVVLLSFALADRINILKREKETAQAAFVASVQENEKLILEQNKVLEIKVAERTHELQEANEELNQTVEELNATNEILNRFNTQLEHQRQEIETKNNDLGEAIQELNATNEELSSTNDALGMANEKIAEQSKEVEQAYQNIKILSEIGQQITQTLDLKAVIKMVYENVNQLMDASGFGLGVYDVKLKELAFDGFMEKGKELPFHYHNTLDENYLSIWCFNHQQPIFINNVEKDIKKYIDKEIKISSGEIPQSLLYIPLVLEGESIGVITVQSFEKNAYTETHFGLLQNLAAYCSIAVANANAYKEIDGKNANITKSIEYAQTIQQAILPTEKDLRNVFTDTFVIYKPKDIVSGDFYWFSQVNQYSFICVADCTGHGVPGGFMSMIGNAILKDAIDKQEIESPAQILEYIHLEIRKALKKGESNTSDGMDVSLCRFNNLENGNLQMIFAGAKSNALYFKNGASEMLELKGDRQMIGSADNVERKPYTNRVFELQKGDKLYFFTDGFIDQPDRSRNRFGGGRFRDMVKATYQLSMPEQYQVYESELAIFRDGTEQRDDITFIGFMV